MRQEKEIEFSSDTDNWHTGRAEKGDLFYRTRTVIDGEPTQWKAFLLPSCCVDAPIWQVWELIKAYPPYPIEEYMAFDALLKKDALAAGLEVLKETL